jgi:hypothetical protein
MIKNITTSDYNIVVATTSGPYINLSVPSAGMVRYNGSNMEVYDGAVWLQISSTTNISLGYETLELLNWVRQKRNEEHKIEKLKDNPAIADLLKQRADIEEKIKMVAILIKDHNGTN